MLPDCGLLRPSGRTESDLTVWRLGDSGTSVMFSEFWRAGSARFDAFVQRWSLMCVELFILEALFWALVCIGVNVLVIGPSGIIQFYQ